MHEKEVKELRDKITQSLSKRHLLRRVTTEEGSAELLRVKRELCYEGKKYKDCCKHWEEDW